MRRIPVGFGHFVKGDQVVAVVVPHSAPIERLIRLARQQGTLRDYTVARDDKKARRPKAVLFLDSGEIVLAAVTPESIARRSLATTPEEEEESANGESC